jgi:hypothetical protein
LVNIFDNSHVYTNKTAGKKLKFAPSVFSLYYVSLINYDKMDIESGGTKQGVKDSWLTLNKFGNETVQDIY